MLAQLKNQGKLKQAYLLLALSSICILLSLFRVYFTGNISYLFLIWNLFLAFVPWAASTYLSLKKDALKNKFQLFGLFGFWLVFFPNAPYILTDLFHLRLHSSMPIWYDLVLILSYAWTGLLFGFFSLWDLESYLNKYLKALYSSWLIAILFFVIGFGIYIGRYLRWNSWDLLFAPSHIMNDISQRIASPLDHPRTWGMTLLMGLFLNMLYWSFKLIRQEKAEV